MDFVKKQSYFEMKEVTESQQEQDKKLKESLSRYQVILFPGQDINHGQIATPFEILEDNIFDRPLNRGYNKNLKKGLGTTF